MSIVDYILNIYIAGFCLFGTIGTILMIIKGCKSMIKRKRQTNDSNKVKEFNQQYESAVKKLIELDMLNNYYVYEINNLNSALKQFGHNDKTIVLNEKLGKEIDLEKASKFSNNPSNKKFKLVTYLIDKCNKNMATLEQFHTRLLNDVKKLGITNNGKSFSVSFNDWRKQKAKSH